MSLACNDLGTMASSMGRGSPRLLCGLRATGRGGPPGLGSRASRRRRALRRRRAAPLTPPSRPLQCVPTTPPKCVEPLPLGPGVGLLEDRAATGKSPDSMPEQTGERADFGVEHYTDEPLPLGPGVSLLEDRTAAGKSPDRLPEQTGERADFGVEHCTYAYALVRREREALARLMALASFEEAVFQRLAQLDYAGRLPDEPTVLYFAALWEYFGESGV